MNKNRFKDTSPPQQSPPPPTQLKLSNNTVIAIIIGFIVIIISTILINFFRYYITYKSVQTGNTAIGVATMSPEIGSGLRNIFHGYR